MKPEVHNALAASRAAHQALETGRFALTRMQSGCADWAFADATYWLLRAAQATCESAADALDPEQAETDEEVMYAHVVATAGAERACCMADELVSLAEAADHVIRR